jgi:hypothetical protein
MDAAFFPANGPDHNEIPDASKRTGLFWSFLQPVLGYAAERYPRPGERDWEYDAVARRDKRTAELNNATPPQVTVADLAHDAAVHTVEAVRKVPALKRAIAFLTQVLDAGPVAEREVLRLARMENLSEKTLKRARAKLKVKATKKGRGGWFLSMTRAEEGQ